MAEGRFEIVFKKLDEAARAEGMEARVEPIEGLARELDEIEELRRIVLEVLGEPTVSYTTT